MGYIFGSKAVKGYPALELPVMSRAGTRRYPGKLSSRSLRGEGEMVPRVVLVLAKRIFCVWAERDFLMGAK